MYTVFSIGFCDIVLLGFGPCSPPIFDDFFRCFAESCSNYPLNTDFHMAGDNLHFLPYMQFCPFLNF